VTAIHPDYFQSLVVPPDAFQELPGPGTVVDVCLMHDGFEDQARCAGQDVPLPAADLLGDFPMLKPCCHGAPELS
jgi:hypothetical protein